MVKKPKYDYDSEVPLPPRITKEMADVEVSNWWVVLLIAIMTLPPLGAYLYMGNKNVKERTQTVSATQECGNH